MHPPTSSEAVFPIQPLVENKTVINYSNNNNKTRLALKASLRAARELACDESLTELPLVDAATRNQLRTGSVTDAE